MHHDEDPALTRQLSLFSPSEEPKPVRGAFDSEELVALASKLGPGVHLGSSSWSFPGWRGIVNDRDVSKTTLARHGLAAYASHPLLGTVCLDRTYYGPMTAEELQRHAEQVPDSFRFVVKAHELVTRAWTRGPSPSPNPHYLDPAYAEKEIVGPLVEGMGSKAAVLLFQFPPQAVARLGGAHRFAEDIERFLSALPRGMLYAVELRNPELLTPAYAAALERARACHAYNVHPTMPPLGQQSSLADAARFPALVVRWMLRADRSYEDAKDDFYPFDRLAEEDVSARDAVAGLVRDATRAGKPAFVVVNNKAEGSAPLSIVRLAETLAESPGGC